MKANLCEKSYILQSCSSSGFGWNVDTTNKNTYANIIHIGESVKLIQWYQRVWFTQKLDYFQVKNQQFFMLLTWIRSMLHHLSLKFFRCSVTTSTVDKLRHKDTPRSVGKLSTWSGCGGQDRSGIHCTGEEFILSAALGFTGFLPQCCFWKFNEKELKLCFLTNLVQIFKCQWGRIVTLF